MKKALRQLCMPLRKGTRAQLLDGTRLNARDTVEVRGEPLVFEVAGHHWAATVGAQPLLALHKPASYVCSHDEPLSAASLLPELYANHADFEDLRIVGRLDAATTGIILVTSDGELLHRLTHPKRGTARVYEAQLSAALKPEARAALLAGEIMLRDGHVPRPAAIEVTGDGSGDDSYSVTVALRQGRYHEVRRMFAAVEAPVTNLHRSGFAPLRLSGSRVPSDLAAEFPREIALPVGQWRNLNVDEVDAVYSSVDMQASRSWLHVRAAPPSELPTVAERSGESPESS